MSVNISLYILSSVPALSVMGWNKDVYVDT